MNTKKKKFNINAGKALHPSHPSFSKKRNRSWDNPDDRPFKRGHLVLPSGYIEVGKEEDILRGFYSIPESARKIEKMIKKAQEEEIPKEKKIDKGGRYHAAVSANENWRRWNRGEYSSKGELETLLDKGASVSADYIDFSTYKKAPEPEWVPTPEIKEQIKKDNARMKRLHAARQKKRQWEIARAEKEVENVFAAPSDNLPWDYFWNTKKYPRTQVVTEDAPLQDEVEPSPEEQEDLVTILNTLSQEPDNTRYETRYTDRGEAFIKEYPEGADSGEDDADWEWEKTPTSARVLQNNFNTMKAIKNIKPLKKNVNAREWWNPSYVRKHIDGLEDTIHSLSQFEANNWRTGGDLGRELKFFDLSLGQANPTTGLGWHYQQPTSIGILCVPQGTGASQRVGMYIRPQKIEVNAYLQYQGEISTSAGNLLLSDVRIAYILDTQCNGTIGQVLDVWASDIIHSHTNAHNSERFVILYDEIINVVPHTWGAVNVTPGAGNSIQYSRNGRAMIHKFEIDLTFLDEPVVYKDALGTMASLTNYNIWFMFSLNDQVSSLLTNFNQRLWFYDK